MSGAFLKPTLSSMKPDWRPEPPSPACPPAVPCGERRNTSFSPAILTDSVWKPAASHSLVIGLLLGLLLHQAGYCLDAGSLSPSSFSMSLNDIGTRSPA